MNYNIININVVYSNPISYNEKGVICHVGSNLPDYDIHPPYAPKDISIPYPVLIDDNTSDEVLNEMNMVNGQKLDHLLNTEYVNYTNYSLESIKKTDFNFIYPIILYNNDIFEKYNTIKIPEYVIECCNLNKSKICFMQPTEGFFGMSDQNFIWMDNLAKHLRIKKSSLIFITANLDAPTRHKKLIESKLISDTYLVYPYSQFSDNLWFSINGNVSYEYNSIALKNMFDDNLKKRKTFISEYHFLSFNRIPKIHRVLMYGELATNLNFNNKYISSLGGMNIFNETDDEYKLYYRNWVLNCLNSEYKHGLDKLLNFYNDNDSRKNIIYDEPDLENNKASNLNIDTHLNSFVNVVTESLIVPECIFFSEKTFKPILMAQPFIIFGNPNSLKKLKEMGYKTFDRWWDESYDNEDDLQTRFEKIVDTMLEIASWDLEKCNKIIHEMEEVLIHNFNVMLSGNTTRNIINKLSYFPNIKKECI